MTFGVYFLVVTSSYAPVIEIGVMIAFLVTGGLVGFALFKIKG